MYTYASFIQGVLECSGFLALYIYNQRIDRGIVLENPFVDWINERGEKYL